VRDHLVVVLESYSADDSVVLELLALVQQFHIRGEVEIRGHTRAQIGDLEGVVEVELDRSTAFQRANLEMHHLIGTFLVGHRLTFCAKNDWKNARREGVADNSDRGKFWEQPADYVRDLRLQSAFRCKKDLVERFDSKQAKASKG
jgi:hypothetical protein